MRQAGRRAAWLRRGGDHSLRTDTVEFLRSWFRRGRSIAFNELTQHLPLVAACRAGGKLVLVRRSLKDKEIHKHRYDGSDDQQSHDKITPLFFQSLPLFQSWHT